MSASLHLYSVPAVLLARRFQHFSVANAVETFHKPSCPRS